MVSGVGLKWCLEKITYPPIQGIEMVLAKDHLPKIQGIEMVLGKDQPRLQNLPTTNTRIWTRQGRRYSRQMLGGYTGRNVTEFHYPRDSK